jgi:hypothetical protein
MPKMGCPASWKARFAESSIGTQPVVMWNNRTMAAHIAKASRGKDFCIFLLLELR